MGSKRPVQIFLAGDSTVANCPPHEAPMAGWGQVIQSFFTDEVKVHNHAKGGASTNSFIEEGRLETILESIQPGDYLFIQFGHNDQKTYGTEAFTTYQSYLTEYINGAREKGATPILITSVNRRQFDEKNNLIHSLGDYPQSMIQLAERLEVKLIDLLTKTRKLYESLGVEGSKQLFTWFEPNAHPNYPEGIKDTTHFCEHGAREVAKLVIEGIQELQLPITDFIKE
ncbi:rhamnogalacturonan acetylesterase [Neobacillus drentensis]|uniref:rhamnogalacturonan acetylesterase n=1 Tax=Neobacillus drentensis TaxID=220684 RepID=UPI001F277535|nr:rhamnogalacturonan acetylesterase [Neobacillus drentensis]ULT58194.1 rhamnogalacturonan acetylesterase [Neobacillus drentensis]